MYHVGIYGILRPPATTLFGLWTTAQPVLVASIPRQGTEGAVSVSQALHFLSFLLSVSTAPTLPPPQQKSRVSFNQGLG